MMKSGKIVNVLLLTVLWLCLILVVLPCVFLPTSAAALSEPTATKNVGQNNYVGDRCAAPVQSYLADNGDGTITRLEYTRTKIVVETYNSDYEFIKGFTIGMELPIFGGFYYGSDCNYLVYGQENPNESDAKEVVRVVAYTRDWKRIGAAKLYSANTIIPFHSGSLRFAEDKNYLYIRTAHKMYTWSDGKNHQASMYIKIKTSDMSIAYSQTEVSNNAYGYVSHSFNQFIGIDDGQLVAVDHGDGAPRAVTVIRHITDSITTNLNVLPISGERGANDTGVSVGGFQITDTHYLIAGNAVTMGENYSPYGQRNIFVSVTNKKNFTTNGTTVRYLTSWKEGDDVSVSNPHLVDMENGTYLVLWSESKDDVSTLKYTLLNFRGLSVDGKVYSANASLSDCVPIVFNGKLLWYVTDSSTPGFFSIDLNNLGKVSCTHQYYYYYVWHPSEYETGLVESKCKFCGAAGKSVIMPAVMDSDEYYLYQMVKKPTCFKSGMAYYRWSRATEFGLSEQSYTVYLPITDHSYRVEEVKPTCTKAGWRETTCGYCSYRNRETLKATGHTYWTEVINPTCTADGSRTVACMYCDVIQSAEILKAVGHDYQLLVDAERYTAEEVCSKCKTTRALNLKAAGICGDDVTWFLYYNGKLSVFGTGDITEATWKPFSGSITSVVVEEGVTSLCGGAFSGCTALTKVQLPATVREIKANCFKGCKSLSGVSLKKGLRSIGSGAFLGCYRLTGIGTSGDPKHNALPGSLTEIGRDAFRDCTSLTNITIPSSTRSIGMYAFANCKSLTTVKLNMAQGVVMEKAFLGCVRLTNAVMPKISNVQFDDRVFLNCSSLKKLTFPLGIVKLSSLFGDNSGYQIKIEFLGAPPKTVEEGCLDGLQATVLYPCDQPAWADENLQQYGGQVTWVETHQYSHCVCTLCGKEGSMQPTLTLKAPALEFKDTVRVNAFYTAQDTADVEEMGMVTYTTEVSVVDIDTADHVIPGATYDAASGCYYANSQGIHAKNLGDTVYLAIYAKLTDGTYAYSKLASYSAVQYATNQLKNSTDMKLKQLVAAMLNFGAEAQTYFGYHTDTLANAGLTPDQKSLSEASFSDTVGTVSAVSAAKQGSFANNGGFASRKPAISFEGAFSINYFFAPNYTPDQGISLYYWNDRDYTAADVLTEENATGVINLEGTGTDEYRGDISGIAAKALSEAVYVAAVYESDGTTWTSGVLNYSIGAYCSSQVSKGGEVADLAKATAAYGHHAKAYFG